MKKRCAEDEHNIADRYLMDKLSAAERTRFEEHFVDCQECLARLETTKDFRAALLTLHVHPHRSFSRSNFLNPESFSEGQ